MWAQAALCTGLGLDMLRGTVRRNAPRRAAALRGALERLGPAYVKVAQAVSTRVDLLEPEYLMEIELLQDRVPPFPTAVVSHHSEATLQTQGCIAVLCMANGITYV